MRLIKGVGGSFGTSAPQGGCPLPLGLVALRLPGDEALDGSADAGLPSRGGGLVESIRPLFAKDWAADQLRAFLRSRSDGNG